MCLGVDGIEPQAVLLGLDQAGIAAHSGSACASEDLLPSPVLEAMGVDAHHSLRISTGWSTTDADIDALLAALPGVLERLRALGLTTGGTAPRFGHQSSRLAAVSCPKARPRARPGWLAARPSASAQSPQKRCSRKGSP